MTDVVRRIHHLNCGTLRLPGAAMVCHVLLLEYADRLALVDTGFGTADIADPKGRIGPIRRVIRPVLDPAETAIAQVERLGFAASDVRDILMTHFDIDHAGGINDFPAANVHVTALEAKAAIREPNDFERKRYNRRQWKGAAIVEHPEGDDDWFGLPGASQVLPGVTLVPLPGHTRGHAGYAVRFDDRWLLHAGDAFYYECSIGGPGRLPLAARIQERLVAFDKVALADTQRRLRDLRRNQQNQIEIVCTHDPALLARNIV